MNALRQTSLLTVVAWLAAWLAWSLIAPAALEAANQAPLIEDDDLPEEAGPAAVKPPAKEPAIFKGMTIGCLGDEWTAPNPNEKMSAKSYPIALQMLLDAKYGAGFVRVIAAGQAGASITEYDKIYKAQLEKAKPDLVIVQDSDKPNSATGFKMDLNKLVAKIKANKTAAEKIPQFMLLETFHDMEFTNMNRPQIEEFHKARDWSFNNKTMQETAQAQKGKFIALRGPLGRGYGVMKELNYTHPFRSDGLVPSYIGATLIAMTVLDSLGEDLENYNYRAFGLSEQVRVALIGLVHGQHFVAGKAVEDDTAEGPAIDPLLKKFDEALRIERRVLVAYFGADEMGKCAWVGQNAAFLKTYYGPKIEMLNSARPGDTSKIALARMEVDVLKYKPALLLLAFAFSDARDAAGISLADSKANLVAMIEKTRKFAPTCTIVLVTTHSLNSWGEGGERRSDLAGYYKAVREVAAEQKVALIDNATEWDNWAANDPERYNGVIGTALYPNAEGNLAISKKCEAFFRQGCPREGKTGAAQP